MGKELMSGEEWLEGISDIAREVINYLNDNTCVELLAERAFLARFGDEATDEDEKAMEIITDVILLDVAKALPEAIQDVRINK